MKNLGVILNYVLVNFWLAWTVANCIGVAAGWMLGEFVGQWYPSLSWIAFQLPVWLMRWAVLSRFSHYQLLNLLDLLIWLTSEAFGYLIGLGIQESGSNWLTGGPIFGLTTGAGVWFLFWSVQQVKSRGKRWFLYAFFWAFTGMFLVNIFISIGLVVSLELGELIDQFSIPNLAWGISGAALGLFVGATTGLAMTGFLRKTANR